MKRRNEKAIALALMIGVVAVPSAWAAESSASTAKSAAVAVPAPVLMTAEGSVSELDLKAGTLKLIDAAGKSWTMGIETPGTAVWKETKFVSLAELKAGDRVKVRYVTKNGKAIARSIDIQPASASSAPATVPAAQK